MCIRDRVYTDSDEAVTFCAETGIDALAPSFGTAHGIYKSKPVLDLDRVKILSLIHICSVAVDGAGTVECLTPIYDSVPQLDIMRRGNFAVVPYITPGSYVAYAFSYTGGALLQWCMETFGKGQTNADMESAYTGQGPTGLLRCV